MMTKPLGCGKCNGLIKFATVHHSVILEGLGGSNRVENTYVPYCPLCDDKPSAYGAPIQRSIIEDIW